MNAIFGKVGRVVWAEVVLELTNKKYMHFIWSWIGLCLYSFDVQDNVLHIVYLHRASEKTSLFYICDNLLSQMSSTYAKFWQKYTPWNLKWTHMRTAQPTTQFLFLLCLVKTSNYFYGIQYKVISNTKGWSFSLETVHVWYFSNCMVLMYTPIAMSHN